MLHWCHPLPHFSPAVCRCAQGRVSESIGPVPLGCAAPGPASETAARICRQSAWLYPDRRRNGGNRDLVSEQEENPTPASPSRRDRGGPLPRQQRLPGPPA